MDGPGRQEGEGEAVRWPRRAGRRAAAGRPQPDIDGSGSAEPRGPPLLLRTMTRRTAGGCGCSFSFLCVLLQLLHAGVRAASESPTPLSELSGTLSISIDMLEGRTFRRVYDLQVPSDPATDTQLPGNSSSADPASTAQLPDSPPSPSTTRIRLNMSATPELRSRAERLQPGQRLRVWGNWGRTGGPPPTPPSPSPSPAAAAAAAADPPLVAALSAAAEEPPPAPDPELQVQDLQISDPSDLSDLSPGRHRLLAAGALPAPTFPYFPSTLVIIIRNCGQSSSVSAEDVEQMLFRANQSFFGWHQACSSNQVYVSPDNTAVYEVAICISMDATVCADYGTVTAAAALQLKQASLDTTGFRHIVYIMPVYPVGCAMPGVSPPVGPPIGRGELMGRQTWLRADYWNHLDVLCHEIQHNYGLQHAGRLGASGAVDQYADTSCIMGYAGAGLKCPNAPHLWQLGWAQPLATLQVSDLPLGRYRSFNVPVQAQGLAPAESPQQAVGQSPATFLRLKSTDGTYFISFRRAQDLYEQVPSSYDGRVLVHMFNGGRQDSVFTFLNATLRLLDRFAGPQFTLTVSAVARGYARVQLCRPDPLQAAAGCVPNTPADSSTTGAIPPPQPPSPPSPLAPSPPPPPKAKPSASPPAASSGPYSSRAFGNTAAPGALTWSLTCPSGQYISDLFGLYGPFINSIGAICSGSHVLGMIGSAQLAPGLVPFAFSCPTGYDAVRVADGQRLSPSQVQLRCTSSAAAGAGASSEYSSPPLGSYSGSSSPSTFICPALSGSGLGAMTRLVGIGGLTSPSGSIQKMVFYCSSVPGQGR